MTTTTITTTVPLRRVHDIVVNALDNAAFNYWGCINWFETYEPQVVIDEIGWLDADDRSFYGEGGIALHSFAPFNGGWLAIRNHGDGEGDNRVMRLDAAALDRGLAVMAAKYPRHFADLVGENDDTVTADVLFQCALFGDIVYD